MKILGWYSLIWLVLSVLVVIGDNKMRGRVRVLSAVTILPIILYIVLNLF